MMPTPISLIRRVQNKDDAASWQKFFDLYRPLVFSYVRKKGLPLVDADEVTGDVFARLVKVMPSFTLDHSKGKFRTWLWRVTMSAVGDWGRKKPREKPVAALPEPVAGSADEDPLWTDDYRKAILDKVLQQVKDQTQPKTWVCFAEFLLKNRKAKEVAAELGLTPNAVCVNANRVLAKVRELCLQEYEEDLSDD